MNNVSFYGNENCGSIAGRLDTAKQECAGSIGIRAQEPEVKLQSLDKDTVNFRGKNESEKSGSFGTKLFKLVTAAAVIVGGLGLAHKYDVVNKVLKGDGKVKDFFKDNTTKVTKPCYELCVKTKNTSVELYEKALKWLKNIKK